MKNQRIRRMKYMEEFRCIGGTCTDSCCIGWDVDIDDDTFKKYMTMKDSPIYDRLKKDVVINKDCFDEKIDYGRMVLKPAMRCPFLREDNLCDIQKIHGEDALSKVCNSYPRVVNLVDGVFELSATMSCPEVARIVLLKNGSLEIEEIEGDVSRPIITGQVDTASPKIKEHPAKYFNELRKFSVDLIRNKNYTLLERFFILGKVQYELIPFYRGKKVDEIPKILSRELRKISEKRNFKFLNSISGSYRDQLKFFFKHTKILDNDSQVESQGFGEYLTSAKRGLRIADLKFTKKEINFYGNLKRENLDKFFNDNEQIFENFLVNFMFKGMYPFSEKGDPYAGYTMLAIRLFFIRMLLVGMSADGKDLNKELAVNLIQSFSKTLDHHKTFMDNLLQYLIDSGNDDLEYLIKLF